MSVQQQLGLEDDGPLVQQIRERWSAWSARDQRLAVVEVFDQFRHWLRSANFEERDDALYALAQMAAKDGGDDAIASAALAWALIPGAATLAARLTGFSDRIDGLVGTQLWIEVRSFPWTRRRRVAANILAATRAGVLLDLGDIGQVMRTERVWAYTDRLTNDLIEGARRYGDTDGECVSRYHQQRLREKLSVDFCADPTSAQEVDALLDWGVGDGLISDWDRLVLRHLVDVADTITPARVRTANGGLGGRDITQRVGHRLGVSPATVRRHLSLSVAALAAATDRYVA